MTAEPDWVARGFAALAIGISVITLVLNRLDSRWRRTHVAGEPVREALKTLAPAVRSGGDVRVLRASLLSLAGQSALQVIEDEHAAIPHRRLREWLRTFHAALTQVRGAIWEKVDEPDFALNMAQHAKIRAARTCLDKIEPTFQKAKRRGVT